MDPVLLPFLRASEPAESDRLLEQLVSDHAQPIIRGIVGFHLRACPQGGPSGQEWQDVEDVSGEVVLHLVRRLRECQADPDRQAIHNFRGYVAGMAYNACDEYLRGKYPERHRLKNKLHYVLTHQDDLALWEGADQRRWCGLARWRGQQGESIAEDRDDFLPRGEAQALKLPDLLRAVFRKMGGPCPLDELVSLVSDLLGIKDQGPPAELDSERHPDPATLPNPAEALLTALDQRSCLKRLWQEVCALPLRQRVALLLNLRDPQGHDIIGLLPVVGVAGIREIAQALEMPAEKLAALWAELPWEDTVIGEFLGVTRQQVINLRKSARERLARRTSAI